MDKILDFSKKVIKEKLNIDTNSIYLTSSNDKKGFDEINMLMSSYLK